MSARVNLVDNRQYIRTLQVSHRFCCKRCHGLQLSFDLCTDLCLLDCWICLHLVELRQFKWVWLDVRNVMNEWVTLGDATFESLKENKSKSARESVSLSVGYRTDHRSLALPRTVRCTQLVITGWWAAAAPVYTPTYCTPRGSTPYRGRPPCYVRNPAPADSLMNDPTNSGWQRGDLWHLFIRRGTLMFEIGCFCLLRTICLLFSWDAWGMAVLAERADVQIQLVVSPSFGFNAATCSIFTHLRGSI